MAAPAAEAAPPDAPSAEALEAITPPPTLGSRLRAAARWAADVAYTHWFILGLGFFIGLAAAVPQARAAQRVAKRRSGALAAPLRLRVRCRTARL